MYKRQAFYYLSGNSEVVLGKAVKPFRDQIYISTKIPMGDVKKTEDYRILLEKSLQKLDTGYIDCYHFWSINKEVYDEKILGLGLLQEALKAKEEGLIRHISFSFHGNPDDIRYIIDTAGVMESMLVQYNLLDRSYEDAISYASSQNLGVVAMGPVGGGRLAAPADLYRKATGKDSDATYEMALRFVLGNQDISCALSGMTSIQEVENNAKVMSSTEPFSEEENKKMAESLENLKKFSDLYCTGCRYCMPCVKEIDIPHIFYIYTLYHVYGLTDLARKMYREYVDNHAQAGRISSCIECGACEKKCPQQLQIRQKLKMVQQLLE